MFARGAREPTGLSSWGKSRWNDAAGLAQREEIVPVARGNDAVAFRSEKARLEVKGAEKMAGGVREWNSGGPSDKLGTVRDTSGREELDVAEVHDAIEGACRKPIPLLPPTAVRMTHGLIRGMLQHEMDVADTGGSGVNAVGASNCECRVHANKTPMRASSAGGRNEMKKSLLELEARAEASATGAGAGTGARTDGKQRAWEGLPVRTAGSLRLREVGSPPSANTLQMAAMPTASGVE